ncbi:MAG: HisA/HisF-related TIM barrel protein [Patescibacteria group bacterium]
MNEIIPAVLEDSYEAVSNALAALSGEHLQPLTVQIDVCDGQFVRHRTWPLNPGDRTRFAQIVKGEEGMPCWQDFNFQVDLMLQDPELHISSWLAAGASAVVIHLESRHDWAAVMDAAGQAVELGLAIDLDPPWERVHAALARADFIQIMGIQRLGGQGEDLDERVYDVVKKIRTEFPDATIQIDGGVRLDNARTLFDAGVDRLVVGSAIVHADSPRQALKDFQKI